MKAIITKYHENGKIARIDLMSFYTKKGKTEQEICDLIEKYNLEDDSIKYELIEIEGSILEAFKFLMGEDEYKMSYQIEDIVSAIKSFRDNLDDVNDSINEVYGLLDGCKKDIEKLGKQ